MTSLQETLPLLDRVVPALPGKVEAVSREADAFERASREAIAGFQERRSAAEGLIEQVRQALEAIRDQAAGARESVEQAARDLRETSEQAGQEIEEGAHDLQAKGHHASSACDGLKSHLEQGEGRTRSALQEPHAALDALDEHTRSGQSELEQAAEQMTTALAHAQEAVSAGQADVAFGVSRLAEAMAQMLEKIQGRLEQAAGRLVALRDDQADDVAQALSGLVSRCDEVEQGIATRLQEGLSEGMDPELDVLAEGWSGLGAQVAQLAADCRQRREELEPRLTETGQCVGPLQGSVAQVKQAADQVGMAWP